MFKATDLTLYTGSNGTKGCPCKCLGCSQLKYGNQHPFYQGTLEQFDELMERLPNISSAIILGNPDPCVDPEFCNMVIKRLTSQGKRVRVSTSGYHALNTLKRTLKGIDLSYIDYWSFSIDSVEYDMLRRLRSEKIDLEEIKIAIKYCFEMGISVKIQPTLWQCNCNEYKSIIDYFYQLGVKWFSFHAGSKETFEKEIPELEHVDPFEWRNILNEIQKIGKEKRLKIHMPYLFLSEEEWKIYVKEKGEYCRTDSLGNKIQVWLEKDMVRGTNCPLLQQISKFDFNVLNFKTQAIDVTNSKEGYCPVAYKSLGKRLCHLSQDGKGNVFSDERGNLLFTICRFYNLSL